jgi:hypothetical protein
MFSEEDLSNLKKLIAQNNIFETDPDMPEYFYLAKEFELLGRDSGKILDYLVFAVWQYSELNPFMNKDAFRKTTGIIFGYFDKITKDNKNYDVYRLMRLDFLRRRGDFDEAKTFLNILLKDTRLIKDASKNTLLKYQRELIKAHDTDEHKWPDAPIDRKKEMRYSLPAGKYLMIAYLLLSLEKKPVRSIYKYFAFFFGFGGNSSKKHEPDIEKGNTLKKWRFLFKECEKIIGGHKTGEKRFNAIQDEIDALIDGLGTDEDIEEAKGFIMGSVDKRTFYASKCYGSSNDFWNLVKLAYLNSPCSMNTTRMLQHIAQKWDIDVKNVPIIENVAKIYTDIEKKWAEAEKKYGEKTAEENRNICNGFIKAVNKSRLWAKLGKIGIEYEKGDKALEWSHKCKADFCGRTKATLVPDGEGNYIIKDC